METSIEHTSKEDLPGILEIYNDAILTTTSVYDYRPHSLEMRLKWFEDKVKDDIPILVAKEGKDVVGFASYGPFRAWAAYRYSIEHSVYVHKNYRGRGISKLLLSKLITLAAEKKVHTIIAGIDAANEISFNLHKKFGFTEVAHFKQVGYKFGRWLDLRFMQLILQNNFQPEER
jgi:phosphinothricin acetyltransferase